MAIITQPLINVPNAILKYLIVPYAQILLIVQHACMDIISSLLILKLLSVCPA